MLTLSSQQLTDLTGRIQPAAQIRWLRGRDWLFETGADWLPKVAAAYFERRMVLGEGGGQPERTGKSWQVDTEAIRRNAKS